MLRRLLAHASAYTIGSLLVTLASFISFPILSRVFTVREYGAMNLISVTLMLLAGVGKLGVQNATIRYYGEAAAGKHNVTLPAYYSTVVFGMAGMGLAVSVVWAVVSQIIPRHVWNDDQLQSLLLLTAVLIFVRVTDSGMINILRAQQRSTVFSIYIVAKRYLGLALVLVVILRLMPGLHGFYTATILAEGAALVFLFLFLRRECELVPANFSRALHRSMLAFGIPMIGTEIAAAILSLGDRYVLQLMLGADSLGLYAASYNLCEYIQAILIGSVAQAIVPMYVRIWEDKGETETVRFVEQTLHFYLLLGAGIVAGVAAVGGELLPFVASEKYRGGTAIIPYVIGGMVLDGMWSTLAAGLFIHKQTKVIMMTVAVSAVLNIGMNLVLVPAMGIEGAALATLLSYAFLVGIAHFVGRKRLPARIPWRSAVKFAVLAYVMASVVSHVQVHGAVVARLAVKVFVGLASYGVLVLLLDRKTRDAVRSVLRSFRGRRSRPLPG